ncbi:MAG TPA: AAA family ATPase [Candidatus Binataceae bacterium]|nr:AAA family ATPase [Candidatus Binataceae bacterium]
MAEIKQSESESPAGSTLAQVHEGIFAVHGEYWVLGLGGATFQLKDAKGLGHLQRLLRYPEIEFHALDLSAAPREETSTAAIGGELPQGVSIRAGLAGDAGEVLDFQAKQEYRRRLTELREEFEELRERGKLEAAEEVEREIEFLEHELVQAVGLGGRDRRSGSIAERARLNVTRAIRSTVRKIGEHHRALGELLDRTIRTGAFCVYQPDTANPVSWRFALSEAEAVTTPSGGAPSPARRETDELEDFATRTRFVGRETERAQLGHALVRARGGEGSVIALAGSAGVGKSRLAREFAGEAARAGLRVLTGASYERDDAVPFLPFVEILETLAARAASPQALRKELGEEVLEAARLTPQLRRLFPDLPLAQELPPELARRALFAALTEILARIAAVRPLLLVVEDLHWADEGSLSLLLHLARALRQRPVIIVATYRDLEIERAGGLAQALEELVRRHLVERIKLDGLPENAVGAMLQGLSGRVLPDGLVGQFHALTDGNPFFIEELYQHLADQPGNVDAAGEIRRDLRLDELAVPNNVRLVIGRRVARLSRGAQEVLDAAAVIGRSFTFSMLRAVIGGEEGPLIDRMEAAERAGLINSALIYPEAQFQFAHELIRNSVLSELSISRRQHLHLRVADALERLYSSALEEHANDLAHHLWSAGSVAPPERAVTILALAAKQARGQGALAEAEVHYRRALTRLMSMPPGPERDQQELMIQLAIGPILMATHGYAALETATAYDRAGALSEALGDPTQVVLSLTGLASVTLLRGRLAETQTLVDRVQNAAGQSAIGAVWGHYMRGVVNYHRGDLAQASASLGEAQAAYRESDHRNNPQDPGTECLQYLALTAWQMGQAALAGERMAAATALADRLRKPYVIVHNRFFAASLAALMGQSETTARLAANVIELTGGPAIPVLFDLGRILHGWALAQRGEVEAGLAEASAGMESFMAAGNRLGIAMWLALLAEVQERAGLVQEARSTLKQAVDAVGEQTLDLPLVLWKRGELLARHGGGSVAMGELAERSLREALAQGARLGAASCSLRAAISLARLMRSRGQVADAHALLSAQASSFSGDRASDDLHAAQALLGELAEGAGSGAPSAAKRLPGPPV